MPSPAKRKQDEISAEEREARRFEKTMDTFAAVLIRFGKYAAFVLIAYYFYRSVNVLAGKTTDANILVRMFTSIGIADKASYIVGVSGGLYGLFERKFRRDKTEYLQTRIQQLEKKLDPNRSSSRLTKRGTTNPKDGE